MWQVGDSAENNGTFKTEWYRQKDKLLRGWGPLNRKLLEHQHLLSQKSCDIAYHYEPSGLQYKCVANDPAMRKNIAGRRKRCIEVVHRDSPFVSPNNSDDEEDFLQTSEGGKKQSKILLKRC
mmetsp:Transcript_7697/g.16613  ORF Transcript_7697/g.16613 Transcript_7697/m.16613 type:complete len:122 (+) Transcript_7697:994-1359(+)